MFNVARNIVGKIKKLIQYAREWLNSIYQRIKNIFSILRKLAALRLVRYARWLTKPLGALRYIGKFGRLLLYIIRAGGGLIADAALDAARGYLWAIMSISSGISWVIHIFRFTREYSRHSNKVTPTKGKTKPKYLEKGDIENNPVGWKFT